MERYIVIRQAYGRVRYFSIVRAGIVEQGEWTENRHRAERFDLEALATHAARREGKGAHVVSALADLG